MSKSLARVEAALKAAGTAARIIEMPGETRTAEQAARAAGCALDQIVKSIIFAGEESGHVRLFIALRRARTTAPCRRSGRSVSPQVTAADDAEGRR